MTYVQAREYVQCIAAESGIVPGLGPIRELLARLGQPQDRTKYLHIAGTNGKGSVGTMLRSILQQAGYRVGQFASPAVFDPLECWSVDGQTMLPEDYARWMTRIKMHRDAMLREGLPVPTAFELETVLAFLFFAERKCDLAVLECGMGGREDATNVTAATVVSLLTAIGLDHTAFLGDTVEKIAAQKGGIIKPGIPVVLQAQSDAVQQTIQECCRKNQSELRMTQPEQVRLLPEGGTSFVYRGTRWTTALTGLHQADNAAQVLEAVQLLREQGYEISEQAVRRGLETAVCCGRFETVHTHPRVILDGAHNPNAARRLRETLDACLPEQTPLILILGVLRDKDFAEVVSLLASRASWVYTVTPDNPRALPAEQLADTVRPYCPQVQAVSIEQAVSCAFAQAGADGVILAAGSLSYLGALRRQLKQNDEESVPWRG
ncbi:MAG: bifunctional folylpolyglutamate synthase/dihydrofolate synthase [Butyricicoccus sp.]